MPKSGDWYQELVGAVQRALDPGATVEVGVWVEGPDGRRDMDVSVRGAKDGRAHFALIECKDWKEPVGIAVIDAFDSKRRDLNADVAVVFSNSGFTQDAARKARRVGIQLASALREGDPAVHVEIVRTFIAKTHAVTRWVMVLCWKKERQGPNDFHPFDIEFQGLPVVNWIGKDSLHLLREHSNAEVIKAEYAFDGEHQFLVRKETFLLTGFVYRLECRADWVSQTVRENVSLGSYDILKGQLIIPNQQTYTVGPFDRDAWEPCDAPPPDQGELEAGTFRLGLTLFAPIHGVDGVEVPDLDSIIKERLVTTA